MPVFRYFDESKFEDGAAMPLGVPARDLTEDEYNEFPEHVQASIDAWPVFRKTKIRPARKDAETEQEAEPEPTDEPPAADEAAPV